MKDKLISVIVPAYNVENYIEKCIKSILSQTYKNIELLIINDGSTDKTETICKKYAKEDQRLKLISSSNKGVSAARNIGLNEAKGEYIFFVDSDDWIEPETLMEMKLRLEMTDCDCIMCSYCQVNEYEKDIKNNVKREINKLKRIYTQKEIINAVCYMESPYRKIDMSVIWGILYKKSTINKVRFNENISIGEDFEFKYKVLLNVHSVICIESQYYNYLIRPQSAMRGIFDIKKYKSFIELEKFFYSSLVTSEFKEAVRSRITNIAIVILLMIPIDEKFQIYRNKIKRFIKQNRKKVLKNSRTRNKVKGALLLSFFGFNIMEKLFLRFKVRR